MPTFVPRPALPLPLLTALVESHVPIVSLEDACTACSHHDEDDDVEDYPRGFGADLESVMLGSMNNYGRQILISTGKSDWAREVTEEEESLAGLVKIAYAGGGDGGKGPAKLLGKLLKKIPGAGEKEKEKDEGPLKGVYPSSAVEPTPSEPLATPPKLSILNASFLPSSHQDDVASVIVLPDFTIVQEVPETAEGAKQLVDGYLQPTIGRTGSLLPKNTRSWPLPYQAIVLLCSHKKRDKKCHVAAPLLIHQFHRHLELHGLEGDERGDDLIDGPAIEDWEPETRDLRLEESLKGVKKNGGRVGLFKVSHIGGHRYAGNVIIYFPSGASVWYGRVSPRDVGAVVETTLLGGKVIPELLRGGLGLVGKDGPEGVLAW